MPVALNPKGMNQDEWFRKYAKEIKFPQDYSEVPNDKMLIMWVNNGAFEATEIVRDVHEHNYFRFALENETRPYKCYIADKDLTIDSADSDLSMLRNKINKNDKIKSFFK